MENQILNSHQDQGQSFSPSQKKSQAELQLQTVGGSIRLARVEELTHSQLGQWQWSKQDTHE
jgi:hypothetical protein